MLEQTTPFGLHLLALYFQEFVWACYTWPLLNSKLCKLASKCIVFTAKVNCQKPWLLPDFTVICALAVISLIATEARKYHVMVGISSNSAFTLATWRCPRGQPSLLPKLLLSFCDSHGADFPVCLAIPFSFAYFSPSSRLLQVLSLVLHFSLVTLGDITYCRKCQLLSLFQWLSHLISPTRVLFWAPNADLISSYMVGILSSIV